MTQSASEVCDLHSHTCIRMIHTYMYTDTPTHAYVWYTNTYIQTHTWLSKPTVGGGASDLRKACSAKNKNSKVSARGYCPYKVTIERVRLEDLVN